MDSEIPWTTSKPLPPSIQKRRNKAKRNQRRLDSPARKARNDRMARLEATKPFTVILKRSHSVNGVVYGPGTVKLPGDLAREFSHREYVADREEEKFRGERAGIIGGRTAQGSHRVTMVPPETFAESYGTAMPVERVSGKGVLDPGKGAGNPQF